METSTDYQPDVQLTFPDVTILNVLKTSPEDLGMWVATRLLNLRLPVPGANHTLNITNDVRPMLPIIANRISFATELYVICAGSKPAYTKAKKDALTKSAAEEGLAVISSHLDVLYRAIQTLGEQRESASRMMHGANNIERMFTNPQ